MEKLSTPVRREYYPPPRSYKTSIFKRLKAKRRRLTKQGIKRQLVAMWPRG